jgi:cytochrome c-type biogenesis protein CcmH/NrfG
LKHRSKDLDANEAEMLRNAGPAFERWVAAHEGCPPPDLLRAERTGALPEDALAAIAAHLRDCALCQKLQADLALHEPEALSPADTDRLYARIRAEAGQEKAKAARAGWHFFFRPAVVMGALALLMIAVWLGMDRLATKESPRVPPVAQTTTPTQPVTFVLPLVKPEVKFTAAALVFRGSGSGQADFMKGIAPALDAFRADRFAEAAKLLAPLAQKYPKSVEVWYYLGVSRLFNNDAAGAEQALVAAAELQENTFADDVAWYLSVAHERAARPAAALPLLKQLCSGNGAHQSEACAGAEKLKSRAPGESGPPGR